MHINSSNKDEDPSKGNKDKEIDNYITSLVTFYYSWATALPSTTKGNKGKEIDNIHHISCNLLSFMSNHIDFNKKYN